MAITMIPHQARINHDDNHSTATKIYESAAHKTGQRNGEPFCSSHSKAASSLAMRWRNGDPLVMGGLWWLVGNKYQQAPTFQQIHMDKPNSFLA